MTVNPDLLGQVREGARLAGFMPYLEAELDKMHQLLDSRAYQAVSDGSLTPEVALNLWLEKYAYLKLQRRFKQVIAGSVSVGQDIAHQL